MRSTRTHRTLGAGAATVVAALSVGTAALPAHAADHQLKIFAAGSYQVPIKPAPQPQGGENLSLRIGRTGTGAVDNVKLTLDVSGLDGVATLNTNGRCTTAAKTMSCDVGRLDHDNINITDNLWLSALPGVKPGASGTVHATLSATGAQTGTADFRVDVGGAVFRTQKPTENKNVKVGSKIAANLEFANHGELPAKRTFLRVHLTSALKVDTWPSNCEFVVDKGTAWRNDPPMPTTTGLCTIDGEIAPGQAVRLDGLDLTVGPDAYYDSADYSVFTSEDVYGNDSADLRKRFTFQRGTGAPAVLVKSAGTGIPDDLDPNGYATEQEVLTDSSADFEATGTWAPDASGKVGTLTVGMGNKGPASIFDRSGGEGAPSVSVQLPEGVTVTDLPSTCVADDYVLGHKSDKPLNKYNCTGIGDGFMPTGATVAHKLGLRLPEGSGDLAATVSLQNEQSKLEAGHPSAVMPWDRNPANDLIKVSLRAAAGTPAPSDTSAPAPGGSTTNQSSSEELADTGSSSVLPMTGVAATAVALGTAALVASRRLRARRNG